MPLRKGGQALTIPMVVLINHGTASAAEILAGALKDYGRSKLIGEKTIGTGTVLRTIPLSDGSALFLAFKEWLTPLGHSIWHEGIQPDVAVPLSSEQAALSPARLKEMKAEDVPQCGDGQFLKGLELVGPGFSPLQTVKPAAQPAAPALN